MSIRKCIFADFEGALDDKSGRLCKQSQMRLILSEAGWKEEDTGAGAGHVLACMM